ncbi:MAG: HAMP domain-containing protein [Phycisphaerales bacterium]|nr:MAG: HAMP domain-containing protein [Phycisphaerales bacterium]
MLLRHKFTLLAAIYAASIVATLATSLWCIGVYFQSALATYEAQLELQNRVDWLRMLVRARRGRPVTPGSTAVGEEMLRDIEFTRSGLDAELSGSDAEQWWVRAQEALQAEMRLTNAADRADWPSILARRLFSLAAALESPAPAPPDVDGVYKRTDGALAALARRLSDLRQLHVERLTSTKDQVELALAVNGIFGVVLCAVGLVFVHRWVGRPVGELREATRRIGEGDFAQRIRADSADELGMLAREVNQMCATIVSMQTRIVEQERLAAAGEVVTRLAHNIRNPLGGLRGLAEATLQRHGDDGQTAECQRRIIDTVDRFESWLRDLQQSVAPMELQIQPCDLSGLLDGVIAVLLTVAERRGVRFVTQVDDGARSVRIDPRHFEQALVAVLTNAVQASPEGGRVVVSASPCDEPRGGWRMLIDDEGGGVPVKNRDRIFHAYFTTKRDGHGLGLAMAAKVVKLHGGSISVTDAPGGGARFEIVMPR